MASSVVKLLPSGDTTVTIDEQPNQNSRRCLTTCLCNKVLWIVIGIAVAVLLVIIIPSTTIPLKNNPPDTKPLIKDPPEDSCIYYTPEEFLNKLEKDPFGKECEHGSAYVNDTCYKPNHEHCSECEDMRLPSVCFCDPKIHCKITEGQRPNDEQGKEPCSSCMGHFNVSRYGNRGTCQCVNGNRNLSCDCGDGFDGFMCSAILKRLCKEDNTGSSLPWCDNSNDEQCRIKGGNNKEYVCNIFTGSDERNKTLKSCGENNLS